MSWILGPGNEQTWVVTWCSKLEQAYITEVASHQRRPVWTGVIETSEDGQLALEDIPKPDIEQLYDEWASNKVYQTLLDELEIARENGRYGWWNPAACKPQELMRGLQEALKEDDFIKVIAYATFLHTRKMI